MLVFLLMLIFLLMLVIMSLLMLEICQPSDQRALEQALTLQSSWFTFWLAGGFLLPALPPLPPFSICCQGDEDHFNVTLLPLINTEALAWIQTWVFESAGCTGVSQVPQPTFAPGSKWGGEPAASGWQYTTFSQLPVHRNNLTDVFYFYIPISMLLLLNVVIFVVIVVSLV